MDRVIAEALVLMSITKQRDAFIALCNSYRFSRTDIEVLAFAKQNQFFNQYEVCKFYKHTNIQQLRRSIKRLVASGFLGLIRVGVKNKPSIFMITKKGTSTLCKYCELVLE